MKCLIPGIALALALTITACNRPGPTMAEAAPPPATPDAGAEKAGLAWPMFGGTIHRNLVSPETKPLPVTWSAKKGKEKNVKWAARLGSMAYGGPVIAGGRIFVGTNNDKPRDPAITGDKGVVMCFRESDGKFLWQAVHDKLPNEEINDYPKQGVASTPCVDGDRLYYVSNRCELVCADTAGDPKTGKAKFLWKLDMVKELGVFPCQLANCSPLVVNDLVFAVTGNGVDVSKDYTIPAPKAPSFIAVNKKTGKVVWQDNSPGKNIMEGQWSNPVAAKVNGKMLVVFPGGDGWLYAFDAPTGTLVWKFNCNPQSAKFKIGGRGDKGYAVATPVIHDGKLYIGTGEDPQHGPGVGHLWCIDITKTPKNKDKDLSPIKDNFDPRAPINKDSGLVWHFGGPVLPRPEDGSKEFVFGRTLSSCAVHNGLVYIADMAGYFYCLDAKTGKKYWEHDLKDGTWCSPLVADGKVYLGTDGGDMYVFAPGKVVKQLAKNTMPQSLKLPPVAVNGVLYVNDGYNLYALTAK